MKDAEQFLSDYKKNEGVKEQFRTEVNRLRADETVELWQAVRKAALALGYEVSEEEAKRFVDRAHNKREDGPEELSDEEALAAAGGACFKQCSADVCGE